MSRIIYDAVAIAAIKPTIYNHILQPVYATGKTPKKALTDSAFDAYLNVNPSGTRDDQEFSAFRHAYTAAKITQYAGETEARFLGHLNEVGNLNNYKSGNKDEARLDYYANDKGIELGNTLTPTGGLLGYDAGLAGQIWSKMQNNEIPTDAANIPQSYSPQGGYLGPLGFQELLLEPFGDVLDFLKDLMNEYGLVDPDGDGRMGGILPKDNSQLAQAIGDFFKAAFAANTGNFPPVSPLVLDLSTGGTGVTLKNLNSTSAVYWDIDRDGFRQKIGWVTPDMGLLAIDKNGNGTIDSNTELFGNEPENNKNNGFETLAVYDTNTDGHITSADTQFNSLRVWQDINGDGFSQINEIKSLNDLGITDINLGYTNTNYQIEGNDILQTSTFTMNGNTRTVVDAWFAQDKTNSIYNGDYTLDIRTMFLPTTRGYGTLPDLHIAMSQNESLLLLVQDLAGKTAAQLLDPAYDVRQKIIDIMYKWAGVENVDPNNNGFFDGRNIAFLEAFTGRDFSPAVYGGAVGPLQDAWFTALGKITQDLLLQTGLGDMFGNPIYNPSSDSFSGGAWVNGTVFQFGIDADTSVLPLYQHSMHDLGFNNVYFFKPGDSPVSQNETIDTTITPQADILLLTGVNPQDVRMWTDSNGHLYIRYSANDVIRVLGEANANGETLIGQYLEKIMFADGTTWDLTGGLTALSENMYHDIHGTQFNDVLTGGTDQDVIRGLGGDDTITGGTSALYGDVLEGGTGNDTYIFNVGDGSTGSQGDTVNEVISEGTDTIWLKGVLPQDVRLTTDSYGNLFIQYSANDKIRVNGSYNTTTGAVQVGQHVEKIIFDNGTEWNLANGLTLKLLDVVGQTASGSDLADNITGGTQNDSIQGYGGNDILNGGLGSDTIDGGAGDDTYVYTSGIDSYYENAGGADTLKISGGATINDVSVTSWVGTGAKVILNVGTNEVWLSYVTSTDANQNMERISFDDGFSTTLDNYASWMMGTASGETINGGTLHDTIIGKDGNDTLNGNVGSDDIHGGSGDDTINGGTEADNMAGGLGNDIFVVDNAADIVIEASAQGTDTVQSSVTYTLSNNVENLTLTGASAINATGNALDNTLTGNSGVNTLTGGLGNDTYIVGNGDTIIENLNEGTDTVQSALAYTLGNNLENLTLTGSSAINGTGNALDNVLTGNSGVNTLTGLGGNDTYYITSGDIVTETASAGTDTVYAGFTYTLAANVENLVLTGTTAINGTGNTLDNVLTGNSAVNTLTGLAGNDSYYITSGDVVTEAASAGTDTVYAGFTYTLTANVENLILTGTSAINGTGNTLDNTLTGNSAVNTLSGGTGNDSYYIGSGDIVSEAASAGTDTVFADFTYTLTANVERLTLLGALAINGTGNTLVNIITGNSANNTLNGGTGADTLIGGLGDDTYIVDNTSEIITENLNEGIDTAQSNVTYTIGANIENITLTGSGAINATGNGLDNVLTGNSGINTLAGGLGNDTYIVGTGDIVSEAVGAGIDTVQSSVTFTLASNVENITLTGSSAVNATGNTLDNILTGNNGVNTLTGLAGNDTYVVGAGDTVVEAVNEGTDTVQTDITYTLTNNVENLTLSGASAINGTGNTLDNTITGNSANNTLNGGSGHDTLVGGAGIDTLVGGTGNDIYIVDTTTDIITENLNEGTDTVQSSVTNTLGNNFENLTLTGTSAINGTGNALSNIITGNSANNTLDGGAGVDTLIGGLGDDIYIVDNTSDVVTENANEGYDVIQSSANYTIAANVERLVLTGASAINGTGNAFDNIIIGNSGVNTLSGGDGNDTLDGGLGNDTMIGGLGNDTFIVDSASDVVTEALNEGTDTVKSNINYTLAANVENLILTGAALSGTGNSLNNSVTGNELNNTLDGGTGVDTLIGGVGNDTYIIDNTGDVITEYASEGVDTAHSSVSYSISAHVDNLTLTGSSPINGTGNAQDNTIIGNSGVNTLNGADGNDTLDGGAGADTLIGGLGNDTYIIDTSDTISENINEGIDTVRTSSSYTLLSNFENLILTGASATTGTGNSLDNLIIGNGVSNTLNGNDGQDTLFGGNGDDTLNGGNGNDFLSGDFGSDILNGSFGDDNYVYTAGLDTVSEGSTGGSDTLRISGGYTIDDLTVTQVGNDAKVVISSGVNEVLVQNQNNASSAYHVEKISFDDGFWTTFEDYASWIEGTTGNSTINGTAAHDTIFGGKFGYNTVNAGGGDDNVRGSEYTDVIYGGSGNDFLHGGAGDDTLYGQDGLDTMIGGGANDTFVFEAATAYNNIDIVKDFKTAEGDRLDIRDLLTDYDPLTESLLDFVQITDSGANSAVKVDRDGLGSTYGWTQVATLENITGLTDEQKLVINGNLLVS